MGGKTVEMKSLDVHSWCLMVFIFNSAYLIQSTNMFLITQICINTLTFKSVTDVIILIFNMGWSDPVSFYSLIKCCATISLFLQNISWELKPLGLWLQTGFELLIHAGKIWRCTGSAPTVNYIIHATNKVDAGCQTSRFPQLRHLLICFQHDLLGWYMVLVHFHAF